MVHFKRELYFFGGSRGIKHFPGRPTFPGGWEGGDVERGPIATCN